MLAWAADADRVLLTHDIATIPDYAHERVSPGLPMPGVLAVRSALSIAPVIEEVLLIAGTSESEEWKESVRYLPLRDPPIHLFPIPDDRHGRPSTSTIR